MGKGAKAAPPSAERPQFVEAELVIPKSNITTVDNFIGGAYLPPRSGAYAEAVNPATGKVICKYAASGAADVDAAVDAAGVAQQAWGAKSVFERRVAVKALAKALVVNAEAFAAAETLDQGKVLASSAGDDMKRQVRNLRYHAEAASHAPGQSSVYETDESFERRPGEPAGKSFVNYVSRYPLGVVALITHWSRPLHQAVWRLAPALVAGNSAVIKPPSVTPLTSHLLAQACEAAGIPAGVVNVVYGRGDVVGAALASHRGVAAVAMVGGPEAAASIQTAAAPTIKRTKFDLANNHAMVVMPDADLDALLPVCLSAAFTCDAGQRAHSLGRLVIHESIADEFVARLAKATSELKLGDPMDSSTAVGPLVSERQVELMEKSVASLLAAGGMLAAGSATRAPAPSVDLEGGFWYAPTLVTGFTAAHKDDPAVLTEAQGPVSKVITFATAEEAVAIANSGSMGLSASVWSRDVDAAHSIAHALEAGYVWVNNWLTRDLSMPFGGWKESGNGQRSGGSFDVDFYSRTKTTCVEVSGRHNIAAIKC